MSRSSISAATHETRDIFGLFRKLPVIFNTLTLPAGIVTSALAFARTLYPRLALREKL